MTAIKICGLTRSQDILAACNAGANAIGLVFYPASPRAVSAQQAQALVQHIPAFVQSVGLFVNPTDAEVLAVAGCIDMVQFHGDETPQHCQRIAQQVNKRWIKALTVAPHITPATLITQIKAYQHAGASAVLLDAWHPSLKGGTGHSFDWQLFPQLDFAIILAGGLTPYNVAEAIRTAKPYAVDVSGGVERVDATGKALKGIKDTTKIQAFIQQAQQAFRAIR